jgi:eukaryotic-like serine/threonine-protein kinase
VADPLARLQAALADRYTIERELGHGGMAAVFLARDQKHGRAVALKVLRGDVMLDLGTQRFLREIQLAARLTHPNILPLYESGEAEGLLFYVMPYVEGESLRDRLVAGRQLPIQEAVRLTCEIADALHYAHQHGVVHRDIKPENILLEGGHAVVADFGIARAIDVASTGAVTRTGVAVGTPAYMSPEQVTGEKDLDARSDIYSLGCVLYEMLAGEPAFTGPTVQAVMARRFAGPVPSILEKRPSVPAPLAYALTKALAQAPVDRFATAAAFAEGLVGRSAVPEPGADKSIAVLPFTNLSPDPENEYFSDGVTEEVINALAQLPNLHVAARTSSFAFKGKREDLRVIGQRLGVSTVLEGSIRRAGNRLRVTAQLINALDGYHLWSERYDRDMDDVFAVQDEIARAITARLRVTLKVPEAPLVRRGTDNLGAYDLYLKGRYFWLRRGDGLQKAIDYFQRAIAADPSFAAPYAGLADTYCILGVYGYMPSTTVAARAGEAAERAVALDDLLADGHYSVGLYEAYFGWNFERAEREFRRAIELNARSALPHVWLSELMGAVGRREEALQLARHAQQLEPLSPLVNALAGLTYYIAHSFDEALRAAERAVELEATFPPGYNALGWVRADRREYDAAITAFEKGVTYSARSPLMVSLLGSTCARAGRVETARHLLLDLQERGTGALYPALIYWELGEHDRAFVLLKRAFEQRNGALWLFGMERLAGEPRWVELLKQYGLSAITTHRA